MITFAQNQIVNVHYQRGTALIFVGRLALKNRIILFEYNADFLDTGLNLSPFKLPLKPGIHRCDNTVFEGLFGVFNDSLPDGWGRLLLDRKLMQLGINAHQLTALDRLCFVGRHGMGALIYEPEIDEYNTIVQDYNLDRIADECLQVQTDGNDYIDELLVMNGSSAGARPKILVSFNLSTNTLTSTTDQAASNQNNWIIKFRSSMDPLDIGPIEYAYHQMAIAAGLDVPEAQLFKSKQGSGYFGVKRFDRQGTEYHHMHTVCGLLHADHRIPSLDYETLLKATLWLTKDHREAEKQFRNIVFNILAHNRDDHAKNFSFLMDAQGQWHVSPAYDLTFSSGPAGEHCTMVMGEGKNPTLNHLLQLAKIVDIKQERTLAIIQQVQEAIQQWPNFAKIHNVSTNSTKHIETALKQVSKNFVNN